MSQGLLGVLFGELRRGQPSAQAVCDACSTRRLPRARRVRRIGLTAATTWNKGSKSDNAFGGSADIDVGRESKVPFGARLLLKRTIRPAHTFTAGISDIRQLSIVPFFVQLRTGQQIRKVARLLAARPVSSGVV